MDLNAYFKYEKKFPLQRMFNTRKKHFMCIKLLFFEFPQIESIKYRAIKVCTLLNILDIQAEIFRLIYFHQIKLKEIIWKILTPK